MTLLVASVVRRHLKNTRGFTLSEGDTKPPAELALAPGEALIGWYRNPPPWEHSLLVFTSEGIWTVDGAGGACLAWRDITDYESPGTNEGVTGIRVRTRDGFRLMRIAGAYGPDDKYKDFIGLVEIVRAVARSSAVP